jgi:hypothetical protein
MKDFSSALRDAAGLDGLLSRIRDGASASRGVRTYPKATPWQITNGDDNCAICPICCSNPWRPLADRAVERATTRAVRHVSEQRHRTTAFLPMKPDSLTVRPRTFSTEKRRSSPVDLPRRGPASGSGAARPAQQSVTVRSLRRNVVPSLPSPSSGTTARCPGGRDPTRWL